MINWKMETGLLSPLAQEKLVPLAFVRALMVQARAFGKDVSAILEQANFPFNPLDESAARQRYVGVEQYSRLCMMLLRAIGDESGGIMPGTPTPPGSTRMLAYSLLGCSDLKAALERSIEFNAICREPESQIIEHKLSLSDGGRLARLSYRSQVATDSGQSLSEDGVLCSMALWLRFCSWLIGASIDIVAAGCVGPEPRKISGLQHFFPCPVRFEEDVNWIEFPASFLSARITRQEKELEGYLKVAPYHVVLRPVEGEQTLSARIREALGTDFRYPMPSLEQLTKQLNMSARTLRRRLEKEGTSFQRIKDNARRDAAIAWLSQEELSVSDVAELSGFSDPSAFHRAFKRWTGKAPGHFRPSRGTADKKARPD